MEDNEDKQKVEPPDAREQGQDIAGDAQSEDDGVGPEAGSGSDQSAESSVPPSALPAQEADSSAEDPDRPEAPEEVATPIAGAAMQGDRQVTRIELPAELDIPPATQPPLTTGDGRSYLLPLEPGAESEGVPDPVDQIFPPAWRLPVDSRGSVRTPESAGANTSSESPGKAMPRVQVLVTLLESQTMYAEAIEEAVEKHAPKYRRIAESEVERGFWHYENQRRAADWRLRGP
jgi:hypothetical protein